MSWQYSPLAVILAIATVFLGLFTHFAWKRRHAPGIIPILVLFAAATIWSAASAVSLANTDLAITISMGWLAYPAIVTIPIAYLLFALWYTEQENRPSRLFLALLFVIPVLSICLLVTNDLHHLFYTGFLPLRGRGILSSGLLSAAPSSGSLRPTRLSFFFPHSSSLFSGTGR